MTDATASRRFGLAQRALDVVPVVVPKHAIDLLGEITAGRREWRLELLSHPTVHEMIDDLDGFSRHSISPSNVCERKDPSRSWLGSIRDIYPSQCIVTQGIARIKYPRAQ